MDLEIQGRAALVTGGSAGIGLAVAHELAAAGVAVAIVARDADRLAAAVRLLETHGPSPVIGIAADVSLPDAPEAIVGQVFQTFGRLDILVNNAGRAQAGDLMAATEADWRDMTELKFSAMRRFCKAAIPLMTPGHWGRIVNMSSIGGIYPNPKLFVSHVLSAAINNFTRSLALEIAKDGILVNAIAVGAVATENWARNMIPAIRIKRTDLAAMSDAQLLAAVAAEHTPIGRAGLPREIAAIAAFLASGRNGFITGHTVEAAGGADRFM